MALVLGSQAGTAEYLSDLELESGETKIVDVSAELPSLAGSFLAGQIAATNGDDEAAIENFRRAITLDPEDINLKQSLLLTFTANGNIEEAIALLDDIPAESQTRNINYVIQAVSALKQKSYGQVVAKIDKLVGADLDTMLGKLVGAWALYGNRDIDGALARAKEITGPDWTTMIKEFHIGLMLSAAGRDSEAIPALEVSVSHRSVAAALSETYMRAMEALARAYQRNGQKDKALSVIKEGLTLITDHPPMVVLQQQIEADEAVMPLVSNAQEGGAEILYNVGSAVSRQGGLPFAQSNLQIAGYLDPKNDAILLALASVYESQDRFVQANSYYGQIGETSPFYRRAMLETGLNLDKLEQPGEAEKTLSGLIERNPDDLVAVLSLGGVYSRQEAYDKSIVLYDKALARISTPERRDWTVFYRRGIAFERTSQWDKAEADFKKALELFPDQPDVLNYLGYSWIDKGLNLDEGLAMVRKAVDLKPNSGFIIDSLGWAYFRLGRFEDAVTELERALELMPSDPVVNDHLGDAYWQTGRKLEAVFQWKHALSNKPDEKDLANITRKLQVGLTN
jgi:tetratricopeptide (TPR) repeat protein